MSRSPVGLAPGPLNLKMLILTVKYIVENEFNVPIALSAFKGQNQIYSGVLTVL